MRVDFTLAGQPGDWDAAVSAEARGYDCAWLPEIGHDPFPLLAIAATKTQRIQLGTAIAVTFARNPMSMALVANDLQLYSRGRFLLGVGSQVKAHITKRFSMPWSAPAERMHEFIRAMRAIWHSWATGEKLHFVGEFYRHTLMTPFFDPGPNPFGNPPVILAGVGTCSQCTEICSPAPVSTLPTKCRTASGTRSRRSCNRPSRFRRDYGCRPTGRQSTILGASDALTRRT